MREAEKAEGSKLRLPIRLPADVNLPPDPLKVAAMQRMYDTPDGRKTLQLIVDTLCLRYVSYPVGDDALFMAGRQYVGQLIEQLLVNYRPGLRPTTKEEE
jgi:hypothetical protein